MLIDELKQIAAKRHMTEAEIDQMLTEIEATNQTDDLMTAGFTRLAGKKSAHRGWTLENTKLPANLMYTRQEIFTLCTRYRLRFLETENYVGSVPKDLGAALAKFYETCPDTHRGGYYICAPKEAFVQSRPVDPILFYRVAEDRFIMVHKWGTDISWWRKVLVWPLRSDITILTTAVVAATALFAVLCAFAGSSPNDLAVNAIVSMLLMLAIGLVSTFNGASAEKWDRRGDLRVE